MTEARVASDVGTMPRERIDFLIPPPMEGSGGHRTAVSAAEALAGRGYQVHLHFQAPVGAPTDEAQIAHQAAQWHGANASRVHLGWPSELEASDAVIATTWQSAAVVADVATGGTRLHFVQDYEAWFHAMGDEYLAAVGIHELGLQTIVIGDWLRHQLLAQHDLPSWSVPFTADLELYQPSGEPGVRRVVAMYQPDKPRRCGHLMRAALRELLLSDNNVEVVTVGSPHSPDLGDRHVHLGVVDKQELAALYASASVGLSLSASNPSRVPFEMMASGLPAVELGVANTVFDLPDAGCLLAHPDPASVAAALRQILDDPHRRATLSAGGLQYMADRPAAAEGDAFVRAVQAALSGGSAPAQDSAVRYRASPLRMPQQHTWAGHDRGGAGHRFTDELGQQVAVNAELNRVNEELSRDNAQINEVNTQLDRVNVELNRVNHELVAELEQVTAAHAELKARIDASLESRIKARLARARRS